MSSAEIAVADAAVFPNVAPVMIPCGWLEPVPVVNAPFVTRAVLSPIASARNAFKSNALSCNNCIETFTWLA